LSGKLSLLDTFDSQLNPSIRQHACQLEQLTHLLANTLPVECHGHFHVANVRDRQVSIMADSSVWATRLRQLSPEIVEILQQHGNSRLLHVRVFSRPGNPPAQVGRTHVRTANERRISPKSRNLIKQAAAGIEDDGLRAALLKLAAHGTAHEKTEK
jgi:hypothetical protein